MRLLDIKPILMIDMETFIFAAAAVFIIKEQSAVAQEYYNRSFLRGLLIR
jgi:hypothetical protein